MGRNHVLYMISFFMVLYSNDGEAKSIISEANYNSIESNLIIEDTETNTTKSVKTFPPTDDAVSTIMNENNDNSRTEIPETTIFVERNSLSYNVQFPSPANDELISNLRVIPTTDTVQNTTEKFTPYTISSPVTIKNTVSVEIPNTSSARSIQAKYTDSVSTPGIFSSSSALPTSTSSAISTSWYPIASTTTTSSSTTTFWYPSNSTTSAPTTTSWYPIVNTTSTSTSTLFTTPNTSTLSTSTITPSTSTSTPFTTPSTSTLSTSTITPSTSTSTPLTSPCTSTLSTSTITSSTSTPSTQSLTTASTTTTEPPSTTTSTKKPTSTTSKPGKNVYNIKIFFNWNCTNASNCSIHVFK